MRIRRQIARTLAMGVLALISGLQAPWVQAGGFSVSPVRLFFGERDRAVALRLSNEGEQEVRLLADVQAWSQDADGRDRLEPSEDLIVSPPVLRIKPQGEQVVRVILVAPRDPTRQMSYRLFLREQSTSASASASAGSPARVPIALVLSLPVFITPAHAKHELKCQLGRVTETGVMAECLNEGTAHARIGQIEWHEGPREGSKVLARQEGSRYLLPGARHELEMTMGPAGREGMADSRLEALIDGPQRLTWPAASKPHSQALR